MMNDPIAVLDANILYSFYLRQFFLRMSFEEKLFQAKWSHKINEEWTGNLAKKTPSFTPEKMRQVLTWMQNDFLGACVDFEEYMAPAASLRLPDKDDTHVVAAALASQASFIITKNLKDFPAEVLENVGIEPIHPDDFTLKLISDSPEQVLSIIVRMAESYDKPKVSVSEMIALLAKNLPKSANVLRVLLR